MIELHYWPTSNGNKIAIFLEEAGLPYTAHPVRINAGDQFKPGHVKLSPNAKIPAILDTDPKGGGAPISVFESAAILIYLAEKTGKFLPTDIRRRKTALEWVAWQVANLGPATGSKNHFKARSDQMPAATERFSKEVMRLFGVLDRHLEGREYVADEYSIADMALYPPFVSALQNNEDISGCPNIGRWMKIIGARPAVIAAIENGKKIRAAG